MSVEVIIEDLKKERENLNRISRGYIFSSNEYDMGYLECLNRVIKRLEKEPPTTKEGLFMENLTEAISNGVANALRNEDYRKRKRDADAKWADSLTPNDCH